MNTAGEFTEEREVGKNNLSGPRTVYTAHLYNDPLDYERNRDEIKLLLMLWACAGYFLKGRLKLQWHWQVSEH